MRFQTLKDEKKLSPPPNPTLIMNENIAEARQKERTRMLKKAFKRAKRGIGTRVN